MANKNKKTWCERILNAASKEEVINNSILRVRFRIPKTEMSQEEYSRSCLLYTSPSPRDRQKSRMPSSA